MLLIRLLVACAGASRIGVAGSLSSISSSDDSSSTISGKVTRSVPSSSTMVFSTAQCASSNNSHLTSSEENFIASRKSSKVKASSSSTWECTLSVFQISSSGPTYSIRISPSPGSDGETNFKSGRRTSLFLAGTSKSSMGYFMGAGAAFGGSSLVAIV